LALARAVVAAFVDNGPFSHAELISAMVGKVEKGITVSKSHARTFEATLWGADVFEVVEPVNNTEGKEEWTGARLLLRPEYRSNAELLVNIYLNRLRFVLSDKYPRLTDSDFDTLFGTKHVRKAASTSSLSHGELVFEESAASGSAVSGSDSAVTADVEVVEASSES
jgi:hypothetical protein